MTDLTRLKGIGPALAALFRKAGVATVEELIAHVPFRYEDYSNLIRVSQIRPGPVTIKVRLHGIKSRYSRRGLHLTEAMGSDDSGSVKLIWFNQPYRAGSIKPDEEYFVSGEFASNYRYFAITNPACELVSSFPVNTARLVPVYRLTKGLTLTQVRKVVRTALQAVKVKETLPKWLVSEQKLISREVALSEMHFPSNRENLDRAKERLAFEEVFELILASELNKRELQTERGLAIPFDEKLTREFVSKLPFKLTDAQRKAAWEIFQDIQTGQPMNRLLEGDVGSGKTVVAALASVGVMNAGFQVALMAPTELLAGQHASSLHALLESIGYHQKLLLLTGSMSTAQKSAARKAIESGQAQLIAGTHAIFQEKTTFKKLGLIIVDEQHRFGVEQRKQLQAKANKMPHVLNMTATPIPRSLALTLYGEMDISVIDELPKGRQPVVTSIIKPENRQRLYKKITHEIDAGRQVFVVAPQIEEGEVKWLSAKKLHEDLSKGWLKGYRVGLLHGKMKAEEKDDAMRRFVDGDYQVLVATTVVEVGVDVTNASVMIIEGADRFGLAQLHQLRGRVGRGSQKAYCYLVPSGNDEPITRLKVMENEHNGFRLAEYDLTLRGPGAIYGTMQHGALDLRVAKLTDVELIKRARVAASAFVKKSENLVKYPELEKRVSRLRTINNLN